MDISRTQNSYSLQVRVTRQTRSSIERDNFLAMYLSNGDNLNPKFVYISLASKNKENET